MKGSLLSLLASSALLLASCSSGDTFKLSGTVADSDNEMLTLERTTNGVWLCVDSIKTDGSGNFSFSEKALAYPEILRIGRNGEYIYLPVDSTDHVEIMTDTADFAVNYRLSGTDNAVWMMQVDSVARELAKRPWGDPAYTQAKRELAVRMLEDPSSIVAYYVLNKTIGSHPLFSIDDKNDVRIIGAVANAYSMDKPDDPRTEYLKNLFFSGRRRTVTLAPSDTVVLNESQILEISLLDENGKQCRLSDVTSNGRVVLLNFTTYLANESPALNVELARLYKKYHSAGLEIYQVGYDANEFSWKQAAANLPWITVYDPSGLNSRNLLNYNVGSLPAMFIVNRAGELSERIATLDDLEPTILRYL